MIEETPSIQFANDKKQRRIDGGISNGSKGCVMYSNYTRLIVPFKDHIYDIEEIVKHGTKEDGKFSFKS